MGYTKHFYMDALAAAAEADLEQWRSEQERAAEELARWTEQRRRSGGVDNNNDKHKDEDHGTQGFGGR